ncbi:hypothetical protein IQ07DRAFT_549054 [Pyrenochaeta sp. DS3sAY3a]|nr:hypothetical protein IQ07DRAFT_549054 [Pyrenochaeta sp. DS3sAY3a]
MAASNWKIIPDPASEDPVKYVAFLESRKYFAVDDSGSTQDLIISRERDFVLGLHSRFPNASDAVSLWGFQCDPPTEDFNSMEWKGVHGGTYPTEILQLESAVQTIKSSDVWFLLTDGEVFGSDVTRLDRLAQEKNVLNVPLVFVITRGRSQTPSQTNISVGISFFASSPDTLILFKDMKTKEICVIAAKGCFSALNGSAQEQNLESWDDLPTFTDDDAFFAHCKALDIQVATAETRADFGKGVSLGVEWEEKHGVGAKIDLELLLNAQELSDGDVEDLMAENTFNALAIACKIRRQTLKLRSLLQRQMVELQVAKLEDTAGAGNILIKLADTTISEEEHKELQEKLRVAHAANREHYLRSIEDIANSAETKRRKKRNQLVDAAFRALAAIDSTDFSAAILSRSSNRARRAAAVDSATTVQGLDLEASSFRGSCLVCCGEDEVMSICFKASETGIGEDNTSDFALNFPLAAGASAKNVGAVSSQNICFQCALLSPAGKSIYQEPLTAVIPMVEYDGTNKKYINDQLYLALTAGLATGAAGIGQLFMAILLEILRIKEWAGAGVAGQLSANKNQEIFQRRNTLQWMLGQLLQNTVTRQNFNETGVWVSYSNALDWTVRDFDANGLASFAITYPIAGFNNLIALGRQTGAYPDAVLDKLQFTKAIYSVTAKYLAGVLISITSRSKDSTASTESFKQQFLNLIYADFNGPLVPKNQGPKTIVTDPETFASRLEACIGSTQLPSHHAMDTETWATFQRKIQLLAFWLLFTHQGHCTAQTFFTRLRTSEPLGLCVLSPTLPLPTSSHTDILLSIFATHNSVPISPSIAAAHLNAMVPFANPFGASVLRCGVPSCAHAFTSLSSSADISLQALEALRAARSKHLIDVYGLAGRFEKSETGLPERLDSRNPPSSLHINVHVGIAKTWASLAKAERRRILNEEEASCAEFVDKVLAWLCGAQGRGNVHNEVLGRYIGELLASFFEVLGEAVRREGAEKGEEVGVEDYEHNFKMNTVEWKARWELWEA